MDPAVAPGFPFEALSDALGTVDAAGRITPCNEKMRVLLRSIAASARPSQRLDELPIDLVLADRLAAGEPVAMEIGGILHEMRCCTSDGTRWLVASDRGWPERTAVARLAAARARTVGGLAGTIVHDLANLLGAGIGIADILRPLVRDPLDAQSLDELTRGARQGAVLGRTVSRLLTTSPRERAIVPVGQLIEEVTALVAKNAQRRGIGIAVRHDCTPAAIRVVPEEAMQAVLAGLLFCIERGATSIVVEGGEVRHAVAGARERSTARIRLVGTPLHGEVVREAVQLAQRQPGLLGTLDRLGEAGPSLLHAIAAMACAGGDLLAKETPSGLALDYVWPALRGAGS